jgi:cell division protein FtsN
MNINRIDRRFTAIVTGLAIVLLGGLIAVVSSNASNDPVVPGTPDTTSAATPPPKPSESGNPDKGKPQDLTAEQVAFHDDMRKLWEDHVTWTRLVIVNFAADAPGYPASANRLLENQQDIGDAIKPYYGEQAGTDLTLLLNDHINIAVQILQAAKDGNDAALQNATAEWYINADQIADYLAAANPDNWSQEELRAAMKTHLDQTLAEATAELQGDYQASVNIYEDVHLHILEMADVLSAGIIKQFPEQFTS